MEEDEKTGLPVKQEVFLEAGAHIGTKIRTNDMREFVFKRRDDGLFILDIRKSAERLMLAAKLLSRYRPEDVLVVASRVYSSNPAMRFSKLTGLNLIRGRFVPGTLTNIKSENFREPKLILVCDPKGERNAILESAKNGVPVIALCDTDNETKFIDLIVPVNNKGRRSLALVFYILARELMLSSGKISSYDEFKYDTRYFERMVTEEEEKQAEKAKEEAEKEQEEKEETSDTEEKKPEPEKKEEGKPKEETAEKEKSSVKKTEEKKPETEKKEEKPPEKKGEKPAEEKPEEKKAEEPVKEKKEAKEKKEEKKDSESEPEEKKKE